ncbi:MAG: hypothetical protein ACFFD2_18930 [Promethearchaeota archaeon]
MKLPKELQQKYRKKVTKRVTNRSQSNSNNLSFDDLRYYLNKQSTKKTQVNLAEHQKMMKEIQSIRPKIKEKIKANIHILKLLLSKYNPIHLLHYICVKYCFTNPETYKESESVNLEFWVEYALSCATSIQYHSSFENPHGEIFTKFEELVKIIINLSTQFYMTEAADETYDPSLKSIRFQSIIKYMGVRGDSFENHHIDLIHQTFQTHDEFLKENMGFTTKEITEFIDNIRNEVLANIAHDANREKFFLKFKDLVKKIKNSKGENVELTEKDLKEFDKNEDMIKLKKDYINYMQNYEPFYFKLKPSEKLPIKLLELFSIKFGENKLFLQGEEFWPLNNSQIYSKPIIKYKDEFYGFGTTILYRNILNILESMIKEKDQNYYSKTFLKKKAKLLEEMSINYLRNIMPKARIYNELFYYIEQDGEKVLYETDGLIIFDENLLILEAKSHKLTLSAKRGSILRIEKTVKNVIDDAYNQAIRCKHYIINNSPADFFDKHNKKVVSLKVENFKSIYIINTTYENLLHLSVKLHDLKNFNLIEGKEWPWTVFINDLRIISEIVECPSIFLLYLQRRIKMNDLELLMNSDELDFFMFFLKTGLYFDDINISKNQKISLFGMTDELDRYYLYLQGKVKEAEKPVFKIPKFYKNIVYNIEELGKRGFVKATISLLSIDAKDREKFSTLIARYKKLSFKTGKDYKMFFYYKKPSQGLLFITRTNLTRKDWISFQEFLKLMKYKYKLRTTIMYKFLFENESDVIPKLDFEIFEEEWKFNPKLDRMARKYKPVGMRKVKG